MAIRFRSLVLTSLLVISSALVALPSAAAQDCGEIGDPACTVKCIDRYGSWCVSWKVQQIREALELNDPGPP